LPWSGGSKSTEVQGFHLIHQWKCTGIEPKKKKGDLIFLLSKKRRAAEVGEMILSMILSTVVT